MAKTNNAGTMNNAGSGDPPKNLKTITKRKKNISARMVVQALTNLPEHMHKDGEGGHSLAAIRNYLKKIHRLEMNRHDQDLLKSIIETEFRNGTIVMVNDHADYFTLFGRVNFTKRFAVASDVDEDEVNDTETESMSSDSDEDEE